MCSGAEQPAPKLRVRVWKVLHSASSRSLRRQRHALFGEDHREQPRGLGLAGVSRYLVGGARLLVEHLTGGVRFFLSLSRDLRDDGPFEDVGEHKPGMVVSGPDAARG